MVCGLRHFLNAPSYRLSPWLQINLNQGRVLCLGRKTAHSRAKPALVRADRTSHAMALPPPAVPRAGNHTRRLNAPIVSPAQQSDRLCATLVNRNDTPDQPFETPAHSPEDGARIRCRRDTAAPLIESCSWQRNQSRTLAHRIALALRAFPSLARHLDARVRCR